MRYVLTLVAGDGAARDLVGAAADALTAAGATVGAVDWLDSLRAWDLPFDGLDPHRAEERARATFPGLPVDLAAQQAAGRRKRLLVADMESTVIRNEMLEDLAERVGRRAEVEEITTRAMNGELDFRAALDERVALLAGLDAGVLEECLESIRIDTGARRLVSTLAAHGVHTALVSGGFTVFADWVRDRVGFAESHANRLGIDDGRLTGRVEEPLLDRDAKLRLLEQLCARLGLSVADAVTVGDGANDLAMLERAGLGVAYHAKPTVAAAARWRIDHGDLSTLLYFQGYRAADLHAAG
ncbi:MAG: phosphoserine phosphatase SerB [Acidobacteriota bacterium]